MNLRTSLTVSAALALTVFGCQSREASLGSQEVQDYLAGRPLIVPEHVITDKSVPVKPGDKLVVTTDTGQPIPVTARPLTMERDRISGLNIGTPELGADGIWHTPITFRYTEGPSNFGIEAVIDHSGGGAKRVFLGFHISKIAKQ